ncbi:FAD-dependent monooxygenase [Streptomyces spiramenti]|uniref:Monooxygenase n=1 Tax=Streptomyces spiramenti TaxID=2720606 RepID=A0ABX1AH24_9ACTN|nr:FAD-dependent monooxygenase [Streptomyces spiramenti]NJP65500.1 monooxygenase [Streptomyces spiramenti]
MERSSTTPVVIVGGGPVGLLLALFLDRYGVGSVVLDSEDSVPDTPRGSTHNARTMEHYRSLGLAGRVRALGLPAGHDAGISFSTRYGGHSLSRLPWPGPARARARVASAGRTDQVPEPMHRANQMYVEQLLFRHARTRPRIALEFGSRATGVTQHVGRVVVTAEGASGRRTWHARYVVGADGGRSFVRRGLGISYRGQGGLDQDVLGRRATAAHVRVPTLCRDFLGGRAAWSNWVFNEELAFNLIALNGVDEFFLLTSSVEPDAVDASALVRLVRRGAGADLPVEVISHRLWTAGAALVAERFGEGRVFLVGDAAHLFTPNGGFGMNTGADDAANLAWKLAAAVQGWGGAQLLGSYEAERRPVALRNTAAARAMGAGLGAIERPAVLEDDSVEGRAARERTGRALAAYGRLTLDTLGVQLGARYDGSPVVDAGGGVPPPDSFTSYTPSVVPGGRAPHLWLDDARGPGSSLFDRFGTGFTLVRVGGDRAPSARALSAAAQDRGVPVAVLELPDVAACELYGAGLVLVRPDGHVAWRGEGQPADPGAVVDLVTGHEAGGRRGTAVRRLPRPRAGSR